MQLIGQQNAGGNAGVLMIILSNFAAPALWVLVCAASASAQTTQQNGMTTTQNGGPITGRAGSSNQTGNLSKGSSDGVSSVTADDRLFLHQGAHGGMKEVVLGKLAEQRATDPGVKAFAKQIVADHTKANKELIALAKKKGVTLPGDQGWSSGKPKTMAGDEKMSEIAAKTGADFDRAYLDYMVDDHNQDIAAFQKAADGASDADVKVWAAKMLPVLRAHLQQAQTLKK